MGLNFCTPLNFFYSLFTNSITPSKVILIPESGKCLLIGFAIGEIFSCEIRALGFGIRYSAQGIWNPLPGNLNPTLSWIPWG